MEQKKVNGLSKKEYHRAYREANKDKIAKYKKAYYEANKDKLDEYKKAYHKAKIRHQKEHPEEYLNVFGKKIYTNGVTEEMEKMLPKIIDKSIRKLLNESEEIKYKKK